MCGRMSRYFSEEEVKRHKEFMIDKVLGEFGPSYNVAPSQKVPVIIKGSRILDTMKWGLVPSWAKDKKIGNKMINARAETVDEKPSFRKSFKERRCLILASGFFEWDKSRHPHLIELKKDDIMAFAGIWDEWKSENKTLRTCAVITCKPNTFMGKIHHRMPVILESKDFKTYLESDDTTLVKKLLYAIPNNKLKEHEVSRLVNSPKNNTESIIKPAKKFEKPKDLKQLKL
jgi:putative SOS response-associated peptidase YedK